MKYTKLLTLPTETQLLIKRNVNAKQTIISIFIPFYIFTQHFLRAEVVPMFENYRFIECPPATKEEALITVIERKQSFMDQRMLVASLFKMQVQNAPSLICPRNSKRCHVMGEKVNELVSNRARGAALSACTCRY